MLTSEIIKEENLTIMCSNCGESWDQATIGYVEAIEMMLAHNFTKCPACEVKDEN